MSIFSFVQKLGRASDLFASSLTVYQILCKMSSGMTPILHLEKTRSKPLFVSGFSPTYVALIVGIFT